MKELKVQVPEGYEIDQENSTFECIKFNPIKKKLTYDDIAKELFLMRDTYFINNNGSVENSIDSVSNTNAPTAIDVYRGKTTLQVTYQDSIAVDSVVVYK